MRLERRQARRIARALRHGPRQGVRPETRSLAAAGSARPSRTVCIERPYLAALLTVSGSRQQGDGDPGHLGGRLL